MTHDDYVNWLTSRKVSSKLFDSPKDILRIKESLFGKSFYIWSNKKIKPEEEFLTFFHFRDTMKEKDSEMNLWEKSPFWKVISNNLLATTYYSFER